LPAVLTGDEEFVLPDDGGAGTGSGELGGPDEIVFSKRGGDLGERDAAAVFSAEAGPRFFGKSAERKDEGEDEGEGESGLHSSSLKVLELLENLFFGWDAPGRRGNHGSQGFSRMGVTERAHAWMAENGVASGGVQERGDLLVAHRFETLFLGIQEEDGAFEVDEASQLLGLLAGAVVDLHDDLAHFGDGDFAEEFGVGDAEDEFSNFPPLLDEFDVLDFTVGDDDGAHLAFATRKNVAF